MGDLKHMSLNVLLPPGVPDLAGKFTLKILAYSIDRLGRRLMTGHTKLLLIHEIGCFQAGNREVCRREAMGELGTAEISGIYGAIQHVAPALIWLAPGHLSLEKDKPGSVTVVVHIENVIVESERHLFVKRQDGLSRKLEHDIPRADIIQLGFNGAAFGHEPYGSIG
jgi:hypothetical protein